MFLPGMADLVQLTELVNVEDEGVAGIDDTQGIPGLGRALLDGQGGSGL